jgi:hypothetical protein
MLLEHCFIFKNNKDSLSYNLNSISDKFNFTKFKYEYMTVYYYILEHSINIDSINYKLYKQLHNNCNDI